ncbi:hypothetical protein L0P92_44515, partial [Streptomyces muensis]|nr:hypothetical protein [Streptomyces muensis]
EPGVAAGARTRVALGSCPADREVDGEVDGRVDGEVDGDGVRSAEVSVDWAGFRAGTWDLRLRVCFRGGAYREVTARAVAGAGLLRRRAAIGAGHTVVLVQPYATHSGALALRVARGSRSLMSVLRGRLRRLLHCH